MAEAGGKWKVISGMSMCAVCLYLLYLFIYMFLFYLSRAVCSFSMPVHKEGKPHGSATINDTSTFGEEIKEKLQEKL